MSYSLHTLTGAIEPELAPQEPRSLWARFALEISLLLGGACLLLVLLALLSYNPGDAAWSTSGGHAPIRNWVGRLGAWMADLAYFSLGYSIWWCWLAGSRAWLVGFSRWLRSSGWGSAERRRLTPRTLWVFWIGMFALVTSSSALEWTRLYRWEDHLPGHSGGVLGYLVGGLSMHWLGFTGSALAGIVTMVVGVSMVFRFSWSDMAERLGARIDALIQRRHVQREIETDLALGQQALREREQTASYQPVDPPWEERMEPSLDDGLSPSPQLEIAPLPVPPPRPTPMVIEPGVTEVPRSERVVKERQKPLFNELPDSKLPQVDLLDALTARQETVSPETLEMTSRLIEKKLSDFGVQVRVVAAAPGPVITRYEIEPATGVKGSQIVNLAKDLARSLSLVSIRVIETIPGKNYMALELPNAKRQSIKLSEILGSQVYNEAKSMLTMGLGKDIVGNPVVADLAKMPHVLVAGTTGSGKSVGINAMILSLLYKAEARDVRLLMIDPKMLEMSVYEGIPHLLAPVVTDMKQAAHGLNWCVAEMEKRYKLMSKLGVRNLAGYNAKIDEATAREEFIYNPFSLTPDDPEPLKRLPHIVIIIDELADLMMVVGKKIEELIARLAQKARAAGIHLILATQRPSVDVITGLIKANIPTRIAFQVSSKIDSRTILDQMGAEALLGMGDMLYMPSGTGFPIRVHGAFVSDDEVHRVVEYLKSQGEPDYIEGVLEGGTVDGEDGPLGEGGEGGEKDPMYDQAVEVVLKNRKASISLVQRHLKIGYNRAARLVEDMEKAGLVSAMSGSGQREILVPAREQ
ncbi:DNA translocase FtsK [Limnohabitans sp.]|uniref:DNA translocase FtsK n=1 Tax=Limnohabitans sp. TaxID=1907725 RepID=UPI0035B3E9E0